MRAAAFRGRNEIAIVEVPKPRAGRDEVVLEVHCSGICGTDLQAYRFGGIPPGSIMGHEFSGAVHEVGEAVSGMLLDQLVTALPLVVCGRCERCRTGMQLHCRNRRGLGTGHLPGAYAEFVACKVETLIPLPEPLGSREGALVEPLAVAHRAIRSSGAGRGTTAIVLGAGPIGLAALLWLKDAGAAVVVSEPVAGRADLARALGADIVVDPRARNSADAARELTGRSPELVVECAGAPGTLHEAISLAGPAATVLVIGTSWDSERIERTICIEKEIVVRFSRGYAKIDFSATIEALVKRRIEPLTMITDVITLERLPAMFEALAQPGAHGKVLVEFGAR